MQFALGCLASKGVNDHPEAVKSASASMAPKLHQMSDMDSNQDYREHCIFICNGLLRGEISAVETYDMALEKFASDPEVGTLASIRQEHVRSVDDLRKNVLSMDGEPSEESGLWGAFATTIQTAANLCGENAAIFSLLEGETHGQSEYLGALEDVKVPDRCKDLIRVQLLPRVNAHILTLRTLGEAL